MKRAAGMVANFAMEALITKLAEEVGISPWEIRYRNAIRPGGVLPNGQITDPSTALAETLEAVKPYFDNNKNVGLACAMKNAGVAVKDRRYASSPLAYVLV